MFAFEKMERSWDSDGKPVYTPFVRKSTHKKRAGDNDDEEGSSTKSKRLKQDET